MCCGTIAAFVCAATEVTWSRLKTIDRCKRHHFNQFFPFLPLVYFFCFFFCCFSFFLVSFSLFSFQVSLFFSSFFLFSTLYLPPFFLLFPFIFTLYDFFFFPTFFYVYLFFFFFSFSCLFFYLFIFTFSFVAHLGRAIIRVLPQSAMFCTISRSVAMEAYPPSKPLLGRAPSQLAFALPSDRRPIKFHRIFGVLCFIRVQPHVAQHKLVL